MESPPNISHAEHTADTSPWSDQEIIRRAFDGGAEDWERLHELSSERSFAVRFRRLLEEHGHLNRAAAASWMEFLDELGRH